MEVQGARSGERDEAPLGQPTCTRRERHPNPSTWIFVGVTLITKMERELCFLHIASLRLSDLPAD